MHFKIRQTYPFLLLALLESSWCQGKGLGGKAQGEGSDLAATSAGSSPLQAQLPSPAQAAVGNRACIGPADTSA